MAHSSGEYSATVVAPNLPPEDASHIPTFAAVLRHPTAFG